jgi:hypothetical protein
VEELEHRDKIPVFIPVPFAINTVLPTVTNGLPWAATEEINNPPLYKGTSVLFNDIARFAASLVNLLFPNQVCNVAPVARDNRPKFEVVHAVDAISFVLLPAIG